MRDLIERWKNRAAKLRELDQHNAASVLDQMVRDLELTLERLAEGLAEPTGDGCWWVEYDDTKTRKGPEHFDEPVWVRRMRGSDRWVIYFGVQDVADEFLNGRRVWPVIDPRKGGA